MKKILFLIHDLGQGGAEKVLVNLVNNMDREKFDITVMSLFDVGVNRQFLAPHINYIYCYKKMLPGNSHFMKVLLPKQLHRLLIKDKYDIEVAYLEGPCARIISGCPNEETKLISWIHIEQHIKERVAASFRSFAEATECYNRFHEIICVSETVKKDFSSLVSLKVPVHVLYNTNESEKIKKAAAELVDEVKFFPNDFKIVGVGKLLKNKGFDRILKVSEKLIKEGYSIHTYILGMGPEEYNLKRFVDEKKLTNYVTFLGYQTNPYKYVAKCDLFVCASYAEGFSTAATEALIVGTPVCTVEVSGMKEMLGENNEYGFVTENDNEALYQAVKNMISNPTILLHYKKMAKERGKIFSTETTVKAVENMFCSL